MHDLSPQQMSALTALLSGKSIPESTTVAGVDQTTIRRWLRVDNTFKDALAEGRREVLWNAMDITAAAARTAAETVVGIMRNTKVRPHVRLMAAKLVLDTLTRWLELQDFDTRLKRLEEQRDASE